MPLVPGTTAQIASDLSRANTQASTAPVRDYQSMWVRMFPLVSVPLGDPYPDTQDPLRARLTNETGLIVYSADGRERLATGKSIHFNFGEGGAITVDKVSLPLAPLWIVAAPESVSELRWDQGHTLADGSPIDVRVRLRGNFLVKRTLQKPKDQPVSQDLWSIINAVSLDDYLRSVVPSEVLSSWSTETLRAQAIAARTYGLFEAVAARASGLNFDVDPSTWFQSYQGVRFWNREARKWRDVEIGATSDAVRATRGQVVTYGGEIIKAYFSANSGGRTCTVSECLEIDFSPPYITEIADHPEIRAQPGGTWGTRANITGDGVADVLKAQGVQPAGEVARLEALEFGPSGRTWRLRVRLVDGGFVNLDRKITRKVMRLFGPIRSFWYDLLAVGADGKQNIRGYGYGHAVGMSQWGAQLFARDGWKAKAILEHYYANSVVETLERR